MRFGYSFWGFLGDVKLGPDGSELSTPDGNAAYSWSILHEAQRRGWETFLMQEDRDRHAADHLSVSEQFGSFSTRDRLRAWSLAAGTEGRTFPRLDVLLVEWRWPIPGRNCDVDPRSPAYQPDYHRQLDILDHYKGSGTTVILWDLDHKLMHGDEELWQPDAIFETSVRPRQQAFVRTRVEPPTVISSLLQYPTLSVAPDRLSVYIGSRYERDDVIEEWLAPLGRREPGKVEMWGNWTRKENLEECQARWPFFSYNPRVTMREFRKVYGTAVSVPLLAKRSYLETGFITPRIWEALLFGSVPVGLGPHESISSYLPDGLIAGSPDRMVDIVQWLARKSAVERDRLRRECVERISFMDVSHFVDAIEDVVYCSNPCRRV